MLGPWTLKGVMPAAGKAYCQEQISSSKPKAQMQLSVLNLTLDTRQTYYRSRTRRCGSMWQASSSSTRRVIPAALSAHAVQRGKSHAGTLERLSLLPRAPMQLNAANLILKRSMGFLPPAAEDANVDQYDKLILEHSGKLFPQQKAQRLFSVAGLILSALPCGKSHPGALKGNNPAAENAEVAQRAGGLKRVTPAARKWVLPAAEHAKAVQRGKPHFGAIGTCIGRNISAAGSAGSGAVWQVPQVSSCRAPINSSCRRRRTSGSAR
jgi:hypothetical protein